MKSELNSTELTTILHAAGRGDVVAQQHFADLVYEDLRRMAQQLMRREPNGTLQPTALVNEAYLKVFCDASLANAPNRSYFFAAATTAMRRILVDYARQRKSLKRGGEFKRQPLDQILDVYEEQNIDLIGLDEALVQLEKLSPRQAKIVQLRWFAEMTVAEVSELLDVSISTVEHEWRAARAFLKWQLS